MDNRILVVGISGLPKSINCVQWEEIKNGRQINISDYDIVFIDFSYFINNKNQEYLIDECLNKTKIYEVIKSGINLYILGIHGTSFIGSMVNRIYIYSWLPDIINIYTMQEYGEIIKCLNESFFNYFSILKKWNFYFDVKQSLTETDPYLYDIKEIAINNANKKLGFALVNFKKVRVGYHETYAIEQYKGKLYFLHSLKENSSNGILEILQKLHNFTFSREKPPWTNRIQTKKSLIINEEVSNLFKEKQKIESHISEKFSQLEQIEYFKSLLWEVGDNLEKVVHDSLKFIGLISSPPTKADDDGILIYNKVEYVLEVKSGLERQADWTELSKLITRMNNRNKLTGKECKGIFIMNHYANYHPDERDKAFPNNVQKTAEVNNVKLITTIQLFEIIKNILDNRVSTTDAQKEFFGL